eukprot:402042_1
MLSRFVSRSTAALCKSSQSSFVLISRYGFATEKGEERVEGRMDGLLMSDEEIDEKIKEHFDEEGSYKPPHMSNFQSMTRRDVMMNVRIPPLGIEPPPFGEEQIREITEKTTLTRENIEWLRKHWADDSIKPDAKQHKTIWDDLMEMHKKGVSFATINLFIDYFSGADLYLPQAIYNRSWARIDS